MFTPYKNRKLNVNKPVQVYRNLHNGLLSIRQGGVVIGHATHVNLNQVSFKVNEKIRQRVLREKKKYVHAFVLGRVVNFDPCPMPSNDALQVAYNPYKYNSFVYRNTEKPVGYVNPIAVLSLDQNGKMYFQR